MSQVLTRVYISTLWTTLFHIANHLINIYKPHTFAKVTNLFYLNCVPPKILLQHLMHMYIVIFAGEATNMKLDQSYTPITSLGKT